MKENENKAWDIIPDIHGQTGKLKRLLAKLGYDDDSGIYRHPERRVLFLGDFIDRGPDPRGVLQIVRGMVEAGEAVALMGNHELNALHFHTNGPDGKPLREHSKNKVGQHSATLTQFIDMRDEWAEWLAWLTTLRVTFETPEFRAVHACWDEGARGVINGSSLADPDFLLATGTKGTPQYRAMERLLKGPEIDLPEGVTFIDKDGHERDNMRVCWWGLEGEELAFADLVMPPGAETPEGVVAREHLRGVPSYPSDEKPVVFGHYWLPWRGQTGPLAENILCMDYSAGKEGPLVACRWNGSLGNAEYIVGVSDAEGAQP